MNGHCPCSWSFHQGQNTLPLLSWLILGSNSCDTQIECVCEQQRRLCSIAPALPHAPAPRAHPPQGGRSPARAPDQRPAAAWRSFSFSFSFSLLSLASFFSLASFSFSSDRALCVVL